MKSDLHTRENLLEDKEEVTLEDFFKAYGSRIVQESEKLFVTEFPE